MTQPLEVTIHVSAPYHTEGFQGGRYGLSATRRRDYTASVLGRDIKTGSKDDIKRTIRQLAHRAGITKVSFTFVQEG